MTTIAPPTETCPVSARPRYRRAREEDIDALVNVERTCFRSAYAAHRFQSEQFQYYLHNPRTICLVAEHRGRLVGYALGVVFARRRRQTARLYSLAVEPYFRRRSVGTGLVQRFLREARTRACDRISTETACTNRGAQRLLTGFGFEVLRLLPHYYANRQHAIRLFRNLP